MHDEGIFDRVDKATQDAMRYVEDHAQDTDVMQKVVEICQPIEKEIKALFDVDVETFAGSLSLLVETRLKSQPKLPARVEVWDGTGDKSLGDGTYVGDVAVYFIQLKSGDLQSLHNAEEEPAAELVPAGGRVIRRDGNPKIILDSGDTVYGCQVWWQVKKEPVAT